MFTATTAVEPGIAVIATRIIAIATGDGRATFPNAALVSEPLIVGTPGFVLGPLQTGVNTTSFPQLFHVS